MIVFYYFRLSRESHLRKRTYFFFHIDKRTYFSKDRRKDKPKWADTTSNNPKHRMKRKKKEYFYGTKLIQLYSHEDM
jgi:hypothetical protein